jgi:hypothetical protein
MLPCSLGGCSYVNMIRTIRRVGVNRVTEVSGKWACTGLVCRILVVCHDECAGRLSKDELSR